MKKIFYNLKLANSKFIWCIAALFMILSFAVKVDCTDGFSKSIIALPKAENGIEKIEYIVNGEAKGSTDGVDSIELEAGAKITFAVKFESEGYGKLHVRNVKIKSENGSVLRFNTYAKDDEGNFVLMRVEDSAPINPDQTYVSSDYIVRKDDKLSFEGIEEDKYLVKIADENNDVNLSDAVKLKYAENGGNYIEAEFSEGENAFLINNLTKSSNVKLMFEFTEGYTNSDLSLVNSENQIAIDTKSKICTLPQLKGDIDLEIRNLKKNSYSVTFNEYSNAKFSYRIAGSDDEFTSSEILKVNYGDCLEIKCATSSDDILKSGDVTANGKVIAKNNGIYTLENIKDHYSIAITPKVNAIYTISLPENEDRIKLCDTFGNEVSEINAKQNDSVDLKIIPSDAYSKNFILAEMYAVPMSKLTNGNYDIYADPEEAKSFLLLPSGDFLYTLKNINEPVKIIAGKMDKNIYTVTLPEKIIGANAQIEPSENITQITENKFKVVHGMDLVVNLEAQAGYDLSTINASDVDNSVEVKKDGNKYTFKNIDSDKYIIINGASASSCKVSFDGNDIVATSENGHTWENNSASIKYQEGTLKFKVRPADNAGNPNEDIPLSIKSGSGKLEKISSEKNMYSLSGVTDNIVLSANRAQSSDVTIALKSDDDDIQFTDADDENIILPEENTVKYGTDLKFKVLSKSGRSTDNASIMSSVSNPITPSDTSSNTFSVTALRSGTTLANTRETAKTGHYVDLCENIYSPDSPSSAKAYSGVASFSMEQAIPLPLVVLSKDPEACECINQPEKIQLSPTGTDPTLMVNDPNYKLIETGETPEENLYESELILPQILYGNTVLDNQKFKLNFKISHYTIIGGDTASSGYPTQVLFVKEILQGKSGANDVERVIPSTDAAVPATAISEKTTGDYYAQKTIDEYTPDGSSALQYLPDCYCQGFGVLYKWVSLDRNLDYDVNHQSTLEYKDLDNISSDFNITTYSPDYDSDNYARFDFKPATSKFKIYLEKGKTFASGVTEPISLNEGAHAKLTQSIVQDGAYCYIDCTLTATAFDKSISLNWSNNSQIENLKHDIKYNPIGGICRNSQKTETTADQVGYAQGLTFYTEPKEGYMYTDSLRILKNQTFYNVDDISKIKIIDNTNEASYNGEWIKLSYSDSDPGLFIRAIMEDSQIKYEIAGSTETISEYIIKNNDASGTENVNYSKVVPSEIITPEGVTTDLQITSTRILRKVTVTFSYSEGSEYTQIDGTVIEDTQKTLNYGEALAFKVVAKDGYDISNIQVTASTATTTNILPLTNGMYVLVNVSEPTTISVSGIEKSNILLQFEQYEGVKYKNTAGGEYLLRQEIPYYQEIPFQIEIDESYSQKAENIKAYVNGEEFSDSPDSENPRPYVDNNLYIIPRECVNQDIKITLSGLEVNKYSVLLKPSNGIKYYDTTGENILPENNGNINYGNSFKFRLQADYGYDISNVEVIAKRNSGGGSPVTLIPANGIYTIDNITSDYVVTVSGISKQQHTVEFRTVTGVACIDSYGKTLPSSITVSDGDDYSFYLSFDPAYSKSKDTADVTIKGTNNKVPHDSSGKYTLSNITENKIVEIINVTKNSYTATFVPAEGVVYRTAKGKEFSGTLNVEYGESLYFKISLLDAYDQSTPAVKMNGTKSLLENSGSYVLENISEDVTVTVENVEKNPEEVTIDYIQNVPDPVRNEDDVNAVVAATKAYNSLSDEEKKLVTNKQALEKAQNEAGNINHTSNGTTISGVDWNVKLIVTPLSDNEEEMNSFAEDVDRRSVLSLYRAELIDLLTGENYSIPYGKSVQITMPCPDLTGYKNITVAHRNLADNMEYLDPNIIGETVKFATSSMGLFGVAGKEIPNYSKNTSDMSISMGNLVSDDDELKTLLGEDLSSELGHLIDLEDENSKKSNNANAGGENGSRGSEGSDSLLNSMASGISAFANSLYNWAMDNEFLAVLAILLLGSLLILIILLANRKKDKKDDNIEKSDE